MGFAFIIGLFLWGWIEFSAFIAIGGEIGALLTLLGIFVTAIVGISLLKSQGRAVMANLRAQVTRGEAPLKSVADSLSLLVGGILMLIPGYVTDAIGLLLFVPGIRTAAGLLIMGLLKNNSRFASFATMGPGGKAHDPRGPSNHSADHRAADYRAANDKKASGDQHDIIEGEFEERSDDNGSIPRR